jgi:hypothetical protein
VADKPEVDVVEDEPPYTGLMPPDELTWWQKQLGKPVDSPEPEPALH